MERINKQANEMLLWAENFLHIIVFLMIIGAAIWIVYDVLLSLSQHGPMALILVNNALLLVVLKEILWTVFQYFKKEKFTLSPFLYVGVISGIRELLFLSVQNSMEKGSYLEFSVLMLVNAMVVFLLVLSYYLFKKARACAGEDS